jgi:ribonuclease HI
VFFSNDKQKRTEGVVFYAYNLGDEAIGILEAMKWLHSINISNKVHIESDCMHVVSHLNNNKEHDTIEYGVIIGKCCSLISSFLC